MQQLTCPPKARSIFDASSLLKQYQFSYNAPVVHSPCECALNCDSPGPKTGVEDAGFAMEIFALPAQENLGRYI